MTKIRVYRVRIYDVTTDEWRLSRRFATVAGAEKMKGEILEATAIDVDEADLEPEEQWTRRNFNPSAQTGRQTVVTT